jgi:hypothetical protein
VDLLNVLRTLRRFKWTTITVAGLTLGAIAILVFAVPKVYQVDAAYVLVNPSVPSDAELARRPDLAAENRDNPYLRFTSQSMVGQVLATRMSSDDVRRDMLGQGISDDYVVSPSNDYGGAGQIVTVSGVGPSPEAASHATEVIVGRMVSELRGMQKVYGAVDRYLITLIPVQAPGEAKRVVSGQLRSVIAVGGVGLIILFAAISVRQAMDSRPKDPAERGAAPPKPGPTDSAAAVPLPEVAAPVIHGAQTIGSVATSAGTTTNGVATNGATHGPGSNGVAASAVPRNGSTAPNGTSATNSNAGSPPHATTTRLVRNGSRALTLADELEAVSSFRQRDDEPHHVPHEEPGAGPPPTQPAQ